MHVVFVTCYDLLVPSYRTVSSYTVLRASAWSNSEVDGRYSRGQSFLGPKMPFAGPDPRADRTGAAAPSESLRSKRARARLQRYPAKPSMQGLAIARAAPKLATAEET